MIGRHSRRSLRLVGSGVALPGAAVSTHALLERVDQRFATRVSGSGRRVARRLGIVTRHLCRDMEVVGESPRQGDANPDLAARAVADALTSARIGVDDVGYLIGHTATPHTLMPPNVAWVADHLAFKGPFAELRQACTGFAQALQFGAGALADDDDRPVVIVGSETGSVFLDPRRAQDDVEQLVNLVQMGDGAGAVVLARDRPGSAARVRDFFVGSLGPGLAPGFWLESGGSARPRVDGIPHFRHDARSVRERGAELFRACVADLAGIGVDPGGFDWFLPHQANANDVPRELACVLGVPVERVLVSADHVGNLGSASIWVGLHRARASGRLKQGDRVLVLGAEATKYLYGGFVYEHALEERDDREDPPE